MTKLKNVQEMAFVDDDKCKCGECGRTNLIATDTEITFVCQKCRTTNALPTSFIKTFKSIFTR